MGKKRGLAHGTIDMTGQIINGVKIIAQTSGKVEGKGAHWLCKCPVCGELFVAKGISLRAGQISSCGCQSPRSRSAKVVKRDKYGCELCIEQCAADEPCKYADILDEFPDYRTYDKEMAKLFEGRGLGGDE